MRFLLQALVVQGIPAAVQWDLPLTRPPTARIIEVVRRVFSRQPR